MLLSKHMSDRNYAVETYNETIEAIVDKHAPLTTRTVTVRPHTPWYNDSIRATKCLRRQLERRWRTTGLECDRLAYCLQRQLVTSSIHRAKLKYHMSQIADASGDQKKLLKIVAKLLLTDHDTPLPTCDSFDALAEQFSDCFSEKISKIRCEFTPSVSNVDIYTDGESHTCLLNAFEPATETEIGIPLKSSPVKSCELDPIPTWLLRDCAPDIIPVLTTIVNMSLRTGVMPSHLKRAHVRPIIKKPSLDKDILNNYRPASNLPYLSKTIERVVAARLSAHMSECDLCVPSQSAYKPNHNVETALVCVQNDILRAMDNQHIVIMLLLDLSAAFDTVDHNVSGVGQTALKWFKSYMSDRVQAVHINGSTSPARPLTCGVPQGSELGPQLFSIYAAPVSKIIRNNNLLSHFYADDTQIYITVKPIRWTLSRLLRPLNNVLQKSGVG